MLEGGRFDYFPRGIHEPWQEIKNNKDLNLTVEPNILMNYRMPMYFFMHKDNIVLRKRLIKAVEVLISNGTFQKMFFADSEVRDALKKSNIQNRRVIEMNNPFLTTKTPLNRKELWFDP